MDLGLPGIDGIEAANIIRTSQSDINNQLTPIVALTANKDPGVHEKCLANGMNDVLSKPLTPTIAKELIIRFCSKPVI